MEQFVVSARKYRPQTFKDVVGQQAITNTLLNAIENNHLASALLFTGPRGVGKTTCARILARKINQPGYDDPNEDFAFNVFELDAASNNSVDDIRNLIDQVRIPPQTGQYKVYIIDEVHMLSSAAFNAFLKTLEEPPKHAIFILATTEKHKIIPTILSRCQIFDFKRITVKDAKEHLAEVAKSQGVEFEDDALHIIAQKADGAMRDALSIFDRVVSYCGNNLTRQAVTENLNVLDYETYINMTDLILENKIPEVLLAYNDILSKGFDGHHFIAGLASHFRDLLVAKNPATLSLLEMGEAAQKLYGEQSKKVSQDFLLKGIDIANDCDLKYKVSQNQRLLVELALMQLSSIGFDGEKKKPEFIIPPTYYRRNDYSISEVKIPKATVQTEVEPQAQTPKEEVQVEEPISEVVLEKIEQPQITQPKPQTTSIEPGTKVSAMSLASIRAKKEMAEAQKSTVKEVVQHVNEPFTETEMLEQWLKYAQRMEDKGYRIIASLLTINDPILQGTTIIHELPNESSKIDFEKERPELLGYLRGKLHNHEISIEVKVNETLVLKKSYTTQDKYNRLVELNPNLELMRNLFGLEVNE
ncbi:DNA polymerase III subunit gamma/tau [Flavobacterium sangjuense]|uniref:DNA polymerase III subunit gamma/tau n=1 Tax=Flavobacterium sangjuense TaxID=2518177 RepID=A0A4P7PUX1_9FLAO|nr:DNA polymerase III subunit gamma/tau [Flavobacterium sangjuense]QBZ98771.1 Holliday junction ATP-dependent DNA helicase RuvB [Flavobacterium sangjuense]